MLAPDFPIDFRDLRLPKPNLATQVQREGAVEHLCVFSDLATMFSAAFSSGPTFLPHLPFVVDILAEALLVVLHVPSQMQYQTGIGFPNFHLAFLDSVFVFFLDHLSLGLSLICLLLMFEFCQELLVHLFSLPATLA